MEKKCRILKRIGWILFALQAVGTSIVLKILPEKIPMNFSFSGKINRYGSKNELIILVVISLFSIMMFEAYSKSNTEKQLKSEDEHQKAAGRTNRYVYSVLGLVFIIVMIAAEYSLVVTGLKSAEELATTDPLEWLMVVMNIIMAGILIVLGNVMPKAKNNDMFGVRTSWSRYNDETWFRTNRISGKISVIIGIAGILIALFVDYRIAMYVIPGLIGVFAAVAVYISYRVYKDVISREQEEKVNKEIRREQEKKVNTKNENS